MIGSGPRNKMPCNDKGNGPNGGERTPMKISRCCENPSGLFFAGERCAPLLFLFTGH
jgi:hypothetical protein